MSDQTTHNDSPTNRPAYAGRTIYDELAEVGELDTFLREYLQTKYESDAAFREEMLDTMFRKSPGIVPAVENYLLEKLCSSLSYFLEYTKPCRN